MITTRARRAVATLAAAGALSVVPSAAHAETWSHTDPAGDVVSYVEPVDPDAPADPDYTDPEYVEPVEAPAPDRMRGDIRRVRVAHNKNRLGIRFSMRKGLTQYGIVYTIRTPKGTYDLSRFRMMRTSMVSLEKEPAYDEVSCEGLTWSIDWDAATVAVSIPRSCLGRPSWVRVGLGVITFTEKALYADEGLRSEVRDTLSLSPRIKVG